MGQIGYIDNDRPITFRNYLGAIYRSPYRALIALRIAYYTLKNSRKKRILLYTDSRGFDITKKATKFDPFNCYTGMLMKNYSVDYSICPEKHTTLIDFLDKHRESVNNYDHVILHAGIVDFSPRPKDGAWKLIYQRKPYDVVFGRVNMTRYLESDLGVDYEGQQTINMFSLEMAEKYLIPKLAAIPNLIWIGCNKFVQDWDGNYFKKRPANINLVEEYTNLFVRSLPNTIDLTNWNEREVMAYTCDNLHLTKAGHLELFGRIENMISSLEKDYVDLPTRECTS